MILVTKIRWFSPYNKFSFNIVLSPLQCRHLHTTYISLLRNSTRRVFRLLNYFSSVDHGLCLGAFFNYLYVTNEFIIAGREKRYIFYYSWYVKLYATKSTKVNGIKKQLILYFEEIGKSKYCILDNITSFNNDEF